jgi:hypothetical protein
MLVLATGVSVILAAAPTTRATEGPERVFEPVDVGATTLTGAANTGRPKAVYVSDSVRAARKFKPYVSATTWNKVLQVDFRHEVVVAAFADVSCSTRFHVVDVARVRLRLMVYGEAVYARSPVGCIAEFPSPLSYEVIKVPRAVVGLPLPRAHSLTIDFRQQPQCEVPARWWLVIRFDPHDEPSNVARLDAAVAVAQRHGLTIVSVLYGLVWVYVEGDSTAIAQAQNEDPDIERALVDPGDPWACLGLFP